MRKWWNDLKRYLSGRRKERTPNASGAPLPPGPSPKKELPEYEPAVYQAIRWYGRRKLRREIKAVHRRVAANEPLGQQLRRLFPGKNLG